MLITVVITKQKTTYRKMKDIIENINVSQVVRVCMSNLLSGVCEVGTLMRTRDGFSCP
jgi:hypothetical protein